MTKTEHYRLNLWEPSDRMERTAFNANSAAIDAALANKAEKSAVTAVEAALVNKANAAEVSALSQSVSALSTALGGKGNCRIAMGSYVGNGKAGASAPNSLTFDFCPQVVWFAKAGDCQANDSAFVRPATSGRGLDSSYLVLSWSDNAVSWYSSGSTAAGQNNSENVTYFWIAIGAA